MPKLTSYLTVTEIKNFKPKDKEQTLSDGGGLVVRIRPSGSKVFCFLYVHRVTKKKIRIVIGSFPEISLLEARKRAFAFREQLANGTDPKAFLESETAAKLLAETHLLKQVAVEWFEVKQHDVSKEYASDIWRSLELHIFPALGNVPISKITAPNVIQELRTIEAKGNLETVKRLNQRLNEIMAYAVNTGRIYSNPIQNIKSAFKKPKPEHMKSIPPSDLPKLIQDVSSASLKLNTRCLLEFQLHTMTRPSEASNAQWDEIDWNNKLWTIPAEKMKMNRQHIIPLSDYCIDILTILQKINKYNPYVFSSTSNSRKPLNSQTVNAALKRMGYGGKLVSHGFRALASTILNEHGFDADIIEAALAHTDKNQIRSAYNRAVYIEQRRNMMNWWSNYILEQSHGSLSIASQQFKV